MTTPPQRTLWRFFAAGVINTAAGLTMIYGARALGFGEVAANATGYTFGLALSFVLNRQWTFRQSGSVLRHILRFVVVMLLAWLANLVVLLQLLHLGVNALVAQALAVPVYALISYLGCRNWVFTKTAAAA